MQLFYSAFFLSPFHFTAREQKSLSKGVSAIPAAVGGAAFPLPLSAAGTFLQLGDGFPAAASGQLKSLGRAQVRRASSEPRPAAAREASEAGRTR